jgi:hypothetical protein
MVFLFLVLILVTLERVRVSGDGLSRINRSYATTSGGAEVAKRGRGTPDTPLGDSAG